MSSPQSKIIVYIVIISIVVLGVGFFVIRPIMSDISEVKTETSETTAELQSLNEQTENYRQAISELADIRDSITDVRALIPEREEMVVLIEKMEEAMDDAGIEAELQIIDNSDLTEKEKKEADPPLAKGLSGVQEVPYVLGFSGDYNDLIDYLWYFEHLSYISKTSEIRVVAEQNQLTEDGPLVNTGLGFNTIKGVLIIQK